MTPSPPQPIVLFNFVDYRAGLYLPRAYVVACDRHGRPTSIQESAKPKRLGLYGIPTDDVLLRCLELCAQLDPRAIAEAHRRGAKKVTALSTLIDREHKLRPTVLRYIHQRSSELLVHCRERSYPVALNMNSRAIAHEHVVPFSPLPLRPRLNFALSRDRLLYRLTLDGESGNAARLRYHEVYVLTNHPAPGWLYFDGAFVQLDRLSGDHVRPFLSRDSVEIPAAQLPAYFRDFVSKAAALLPLDASGFEYRELSRPEDLRLAARPHPFDAGRYLLHPEVRYGDRYYPYTDPREVVVEYSTRPPYFVHRIERHREAEAELLAPLLELGIRELTDSPAYTVATGTSPLLWLLEQRESLRERGIGVVPPEENGRAFSHHAGSIQLEAREERDWLDLTATVIVGPHRIPFAQLVRHLQRGDDRFILPDDTIFIIPREWFTRYRATLQFARVQGPKVRLARAHAPLLHKLGVETGSGERRAEDLSTITPGEELRATLRPYQLEGFQWLLRHYREQLGACLADDMGLGKTLQTIAMLVYAKAQSGTAPPRAAAAGGQFDLFGGGQADEEFLQPLRALIILPASLVFNWRAELERFAPHLTVKVNTGTKRDRDAQILRRFDVVLTTYQTALRDEGTLTKVDWTYIVLDESQQIKNRQSKVFRALNGLPAAHRISLSGTPIENSLSDLWSQMQFINPGLLRSYAFFKKHFIVPIEVQDDEDKKEELRELVQPYLLRRTKAEVAPDLPDLDVQEFYCDMTAAQRKVYEAEKSAARNALLGNYAPGDGQYRLRVIQTLTRLRQLANHPALVEEDYDKDSGKFAEVLEQWDTVRRSGQKVLIFSSMVRYLERFRGALDARNAPYCWITGAVSGEQRAAEVHRFQTDPAVQTFFISIKAGGTGLNLTAADYVFILDPWWNPTIEDQAIARAHRIGRQGNVFARKFLSSGTIEEKINRLQQRKKLLAEEIIGDGGGLSFERGELEYLLD